MKVVNKGLLDAIKSEGNSTVYKPITIEDLKSVMADLSKVPEMPVSELMTWYTKTGVLFIDRSADHEKVAYPRSQVVYMIYSADIDDPDFLLDAPDDHRCRVIELIRKCRQDIKYDLPEIVKI